MLAGLLACLLADMSASIIAGPSDSSFADKPEFASSERALVVAVFFVEDLDAEVDAFVADRAGWSGDDLADVARARLPQNAQRASSLLSSRCPSLSSCLATSRAALASCSNAEARV